MNKEEQKKLLTEIMDDDAKDGLYHIGDTNKMVTAVEFLLSELDIVKLIEREKLTMAAEVVRQAKAMEIERRKEDFKIGYTQGYLDAQCNHINDADNASNEYNYLNQSE
jgi:hypothetical protein